MTNKRGPVRGIREAQVDVIVVGAGPAGATAAAHLARAGIDVVLVEKSTFPREKVCGDGLTPRGVKQLIDLGVDTREEAGWVHNRGLRIVGGGAAVELDWPDLASFPRYGLVRRRDDFDELLVRVAQSSGAELVEDTTVTGALVDERSGRVVGVQARSGPERTAMSYRAQLVLACDGVAARLASSMHRAKRDDRPLGVAVRRYYASPRTQDDFLETHVELWDRSNPAGPKLLPGYGWIFGMGDGTVNVGLGALSSQVSGKMDYRALLRSWLDATPEEWELREQNATGRIAGAALPMAFNRVPHYRDGLLLVGDAGGMVNPFNGEGISYAMESARIAAECVSQALRRSDGLSRERALAQYPSALSAAFGGYFRLGMAFTRLMGNRTLMRAATKHGLRKATFMRFLLKLLANLYEPHDGDAMDRVIDAANRLTPTA